MTPEITAATLQTLDGRLLASGEALLSASQLQAVFWPASHTLWDNFPETRTILLVSAGQSWLATAVEACRAPHDLIPDRLKNLPHYHLWIEQQDASHN